MGEEALFRGEAELHEREEKEGAIVILLIRSYRLNIRDRLIELVEEVFSNPGRRHVPMIRFLIKVRKMGQIRT